MSNKLRYITALLLLCATTVLWAGCSRNSCEPVCADPCQPVCPPICKPVCPPPCKPVCPPPCEPVCKPVCRPVCPPPCEPVCRPVCPPVCRPVCPPPCEPVCRPVCPPPCEPVCKPVCKPVCPPPCEPVCKPVCPAPCPPPCEPSCKAPIRCKHPQQNELKCIDGIIVSARNPQLCMLGDQYPLEFDIRACDDVCDVVVTTHLPEGVSFIRSTPPAHVDGRTVIWDIGSMQKCQTIPAKVWLRCDCEGELCACFCATATPTRFCSILCAKPVLNCHICGPEEVCPNDPVHYSLTVSNRGSCAAEDVVATINVPDGLEHSSCLRTLCFRLGRLEPCQTKQINACFTAVRRGKVCTTALVTACNADSTSCQACTCICCCAVDLVKTGPKEVQIGKNADYVITLSNQGDKPLTEVIVTDIAPASTSIVAAQGAAINGNQAVWKLRELKPGEKVTFNISLTTCTPGCFTNRVSVTNCQGCCASSEFTTRWRGRPALTVCICDTEDPVCIGEPTSYCISVVNQGSEADDNVSVIVHFPAEIEPIDASGDTPGQVNGQTVTFAPYDNFRPRQTLNYRVNARAAKSGDGRVVVDVTSASITTPITQQESTIVN